MIVFWKISIINVILHPAEHSGANCPDGGIGRRARLKIWLSQGSAGSIPVLGTKTLVRSIGVFYLRASKACFCKRENGKLRATLQALQGLWVRPPLRKSAQRSGADNPVLQTDFILEKSRINFSSYYYFPLTS